MAQQGAEDMEAMLKARWKNETYAVLICLKRIKGAVAAAGGEYSEAGKEAGRGENYSATSREMGKLDGVKAREMLIEEGLWRTILAYV